MTRTTRSRALVAASATLLITLGLAGCSADAEPPVETTLPTASEAPATEPATDTPTEEPAAGATCDDVLTPEAYAKLEADGLEPVEFGTIDALATRIEDEGGLVCDWGKPQSDVMLHVRQAPVDDEAAWTDALTAAGYTQSDDALAGAWTGPVEPGSGISPVVVLADGTITFVSSPAFAEWIRPAS